MKNTLTSDHPLVSRLQSDIANERARLHEELQRIDLETAAQHRDDQPAGRLARVFALRSA